MRQIVTWLDNLLQVLGSVMMGSLILIIFLQVVSRYVFHAAMAWPEEVAKYLFIGLAYAGGAITMYYNKNLRVDALLSVCSPRTIHFLNILASLCTCIYCILAAWFTFEMMLEVMDMDQMAASMDIPVWPSWIPIPLGFALMGLYSLMHLLLLLRGEEE